LPTSESNNRTSPPDISIVIVSWNTRDDLRHCLESLFANEGASYEVIAIDNASADDSAEMVRTEFPSVKLIANDANLGFAKGSNQGIAVSAGRYILLLNPDSEVRPGFISCMVAFGDEHPEYGIFGPKVLNPNGTLQYSCRRFPTLAAGFFRNTILGKYFPHNTYLMDYLMANWDHNDVREVDWVSGCSMTVRREALDDIGMLDEQFYMYVEDVDFAYRAKQKGYKVAYNPGAVVVHARAKSSDKTPNRMIVEFHKSMYRFYKKHYAKNWSLLTRAVVPLGLIARAAFFIARNDYQHFKYLLTIRTGRDRNRNKESAQ
jgi:GT2 family glycosyltransferase